MNFFENLMGRINGTTAGNEKNAAIDFYINQRTEESHKILDGFLSIEKLHLLSDLKEIPNIYSKETFLKDLSHYIDIDFTTSNKNFNEIVIDKLNDFCQKKDVIDIDSFYDDFSEYIYCGEHHKELTAEEWQSLLKAGQYLLSNEVKIRRYFSSITLNRILRNEFHNEIKIQSKVSKSIPLIYCIHEFFDLIFSLKKEVKFLFENLFFNNLFKMKIYEKQLYRINAISHRDKRKKWTY